MQTICRYTASQKYTVARACSLDLFRCELLELLYNILRQYVLMAGKTRTVRQWCYVRDDRDAGSEMPPAVWFAYSPDRKGIHPQNHLSGYSGVLQADAYGGYRVLYESGRITEAACMAHVRGKIHDVHARPRKPCSVSVNCMPSRSRSGAVQQNSVWRQEKPELRH